MTETGLLIVEDEEAIKNKLMHNVDWSAHGFIPVLGASNGKEALTLLKNQPVDIMVTDIQMPLMNGIELIKAVKKLNYPLKIIVISGFAEFEYARESIKFNVCEYLLKPFATKRLLEVALRVREELMKEQAEELELKDLRAQISNSMAALQEKFLMDLLNRNVPKSEISSKLRFFGFEEYKNKNYQVVVMELHDTQRNITNEENKYLLNLQFHRQAKRVLKDSPYQYLLLNPYHHQIVAVIINPDQNLPLRLEEYLTKLRMSFNQDMVFGVSHCYTGLQDLSVAYREACVALQYIYIHGLNRVYSINDLNLNHPGYHKSFYQLYQNRIFDDLRIGAHNEVHNDLNCLFAEMRTSRLNPETIRIIASNLLLLTCATLNELGHNPEEIFKGSLPSLSDISHTESLNDLEEIFRNFFSRINNFINQKRNSINNQRIEEIRLYLEENYASDITLSAIAEQYQISPGYLSLLFTEQTGKNFVDYLTDRRISKAKELLKHTEMRIYEIAMMVGYNDPFYFSNCFKKLTGKTPTEYREQMRIG